MDYQQLLLKNQLCFPLYAVSRQIIRAYKPYLDPLDLTYTQYITLLALWEKDDVTVKELGQTLFLDSGTLTPLLKKMEKQGLVQRQRSLEDERTVRIALTDAGRDLQHQAADIPLALASTLVLEPDEAITLHRLLHKMLAETE